TGVDVSQILSLAAPRQASVVYAGTGSGLFRSQDAGANWTLTSLGDPVSAIASDPSDAAHLLAFAESGMKVTRDGGRTWKPANQGLPAGDFFGAIVISPTDAKLAYAAAATTLYTTTDGGASWSVLRSGQ